MIYVHILIALFNIITGAFIALATLVWDTFIVLVALILWVLLTVYSTTYNLIFSEDTP